MPRRDPVAGVRVTQALAGLKVVDLSRILAGPFCTQLLSDLGATIWEVESLRGDDTRRWGPPFVDGESAYYLSTNRGKFSLSVNLKDARGQEIVRALAARADVLIENFKVGDLARYGLDYASLQALNPRLVYASITGFGQDGPRANEPGYDVALQGITGIMSVTGEPDGSPMKVGVAWIDVLTGLTAAVGVLAALRERDRSGQGQHIDLALFDVGLMAMVNQAQRYLSTREPPNRMGTLHPQIVPYQAFQAADAWFILAVGNDQQYRKLCTAAGRPDLWEDQRYQTNAGRVEHRASLVPELERLFRSRPRTHWLDLLPRQGVPATPVNNLAEAFADPQAGHRGVAWEVQHATIGKLPLVANALQHMSHTPARPAGPPPLLGQHTREVLTSELGYTPDRLAALAADGVIKMA